MLLMKKIRIGGPRYLSKSIIIFFLFRKWGSRGDEGCDGCPSKTYQEFEGDNGYPKPDLLVLAYSMQGADQINQQWGTWLSNKGGRKSIGFARLYMSDNMKVSRSKEENREIGRLYSIKFFHNQNIFFGIYTSIILFPTFVVVLHV